VCVCGVCVCVCVCEGRGGACVQGRGAARRHCTV